MRKKKNPTKQFTKYTLMIVGISFHLFFISCQYISTEQKEITIDTFYVDYNGRITYHIRNFRNSEECVSKVFICLEETGYNGWIDFISNTKATHIEHKQVYIRRGTDHFLFLKCKSTPFAIRDWGFNIQKKI